MSTAQELLRAGKLGDCLAALQGEVRRAPADPKLRIFLAQVLMLTGDWDRTATQLAVAAELDAAALPMRHAYTAAMQCERLRDSVLRGERSPLIFGDPRPGIARLVQSLASLAAGHAAQADELRSRAFEAAPASTGTVNGAAFDWIADADSRFGPVLEVMLNGAYYWVPFERIATIRIEPPEDLRDLVWLPAAFTWANGGETMGFIPTRYAGSEACEDTQLRLARKTEWRAIGDESFAGHGQRVLATSAEEVPLLQVRELTLRPAGP
jgi:type VI secretion system protein ImpE